MNREEYRKKWVVDSTSQPQLHRGLIKSCTKFKFKPCNNFDPFVIMTVVNKIRRCWRWSHDLNDLFLKYTDSTAQKMKFCIKDFFSKCDQIRRKLRIWLLLLKKFLMENFIFCAVLFVVRRAGSRLFYSMISDGKKEFMLCIESRHTVHISCSVWCASHKSNIIKTFNIFIFKDFVKK